jgi:hypothetical protein
MKIPSKSKITAVGCGSRWEIKIIQCCALANALSNNGIVQGSSFTEKGRRLIESFLINVESTLGS